MRYCAFLRAINVGRHNRIRMVDLRDLCVAAGFDGLTTYLQTGNLLFESDVAADEAAVRLEDAIAAHGLRNVAAAVRTLDELDAIAADPSFDAYPVERYYRLVTLYRDPLPGQARSEAVALPGAAGVREAELLWVGDRESGPYTDVAALLGRRHKGPGTTRYHHVVADITVRLRAI